MVYLFDTSALVKYYILEHGSTWVRKIIGPRDGQGGSEGNTVFIADIGVAEVGAAFAVLHRTGRIRRGTWDGAFELFMTDIEIRYQLIRTIPTDFLHAAELTRPHPLKAYDAVYLAVALRYHGLLAVRNEPLTFVSGDNTLLTAAHAQNLTTDNPFNHIQLMDHPS